MNNELVQKLRLEYREYLCKLLEVGRLALNAKVSNSFANYIASWVNYEYDKFDALYDTYKTDFTTFKAILISLKSTYSHIFDRYNVGF